MLCSSFCSLNCLLCACVMVSSAVYCWSCHCTRERHIHIGCISPHIIFTKYYMYYTNLKIMVNYLKIVNILIINTNIRSNFMFLFAWDCEYSVNRGATLVSFLKYSHKMFCKFWDVYYTS